MSKSVREKINDGHYTVQLNYPNGRCDCGNYAHRDDAYCKHCGTKLEDIRNKIEEEKSKFRKEEGRLYELFREEALEEVGLGDHDKKDKIFSYCYDKGHSSGYGDVLNYLIDMSELFLN